MKRERLRAIDGLGVVLALALALAVSPIAYVETSCVAGQAERPAPSALEREPDYRRPAAATYLAWPEWYVIDAYADLAAVARKSSESAFDYGGAVANFWKGHCATTQAASLAGPVAIESKATNYLIGYVFTFEMVAKGLWERTIGAATAWLRGPARTSEDEFGIAVLEDYAAFLRRTPAGKYPFSQDLDRFWRETPTTGDSPVRKWERRVLFAMEYLGRSLYAHPAGALGPESAEKIRSVVDRMDKADLAAEPRILKLRDLPGRGALVETPGGADFSDVVRSLGERGRSFVEIAGARRVLTSALAPADKPIDYGGARPIFSAPIQSRPGWLRVWLDGEVETVTAQAALLEPQGAQFERACQ